MAQCTEKTERRLCQKVMEGNVRFSTENICDADGEGKTDWDSTCVEIYILPLCCRIIDFDV